MTILPHAASRQRPSADLLAQKLAPCNLNQIFFPGYAVVASDRTRESLTLKLEATEPADPRRPVPRRHGGLAPCADSASSVQVWVSSHGNHSVDSTPRTVHQPIHRAHSKSDAGCGRLSDGCRREIQPRVGCRSPLRQGAARGIVQRREHSRPQDHCC